MVSYANRASDPTWSLLFIGIVMVSVSETRHPGLIPIQVYLRLLGWAQALPVDQPACLASLGLCSDVRRCRWSAGQYCRRANIHLIGRQRASIPACRRRSSAVRAVASASHPPWLIHFLTILMHFGADPFHAWVRCAVVFRSMVS